MRCHKYCAYNSIGLFFLSILLAWGWPIGADALERGLDLNLSAREEYNDNIFFSSDEELEDFITTLSGGLSLYSRTERSNIDLSARVDQLLYQDQDALDATDEVYSGKVDYVFTPLWQGGISGGFTRDSRPDRDIDVTGLVLDTSERERSKGGAFVNCQFAEKTSATLSYHFSDEDYRSAESSDVISHNAGLGLKHNWSKMFDNTFLIFNSSYSLYAYDTAQISISSGTLGLDKRISEMWTVSASYGARYQTSEFDSTETAEVITDDKWGSVWHLGVDYRGERGQFGLSGNHDITPSSGLDGATERTSFSLRLSYRVARQSSAGISFNYHLNNADAGKLATQDVDLQTWQITPNLSFALLDDLLLIARYQYSQVENRVLNTSAIRQFAILQLAYSLTLWD